MRDLFALDLVCQPSQLVQEPDQGFQRGRVAGFGRHAVKKAINGCGDRVP
jgi:hypothetical protein